MTVETKKTLDPNEFRDVIGYFASGVTVITTVVDGVPYGTTASAVSSLSLDPPMLLICMNKQSSTGQAIAKSGMFAVNILGEGHADLAKRFATKDPDKFTTVATSVGQSGMPLLDDALGTLECRVADAPTGGTHWVFLSEVRSASARPGPPLAYFRGRFGRLQLQEEIDAHHQLRAEVINRRRGPASLLDVAEVAQSLDVTQATAYHAIVELVGEGLATSDGAGRFVVAPLTKAAAFDVFRARFAVMKGVLELTVGHVSSAELTELRRLVDLMEPDDEPVDSWIGHALDIFDFLVGLTGSGALSDAFHRVSAASGIVSARLAESWPDSYEKRRDSADRFHLLADAYDSGDLAAASRALDRITEIADESAELVFAREDTI